MIDHDHWTPPPPGDTREKLPAHLLAMIVARPYTSTACQTGEALTSAIVRYPEAAFELQSWSKVMHKRCRLNNKFTDLKCACTCGHPRQEEADDTDLTEGEIDRLAATGTPVEIEAPAKKGWSGLAS